MDVNRLAPWYRWIEYAAFGRTLERSRYAFLHKLAAARRVLVLGEGDGRALSQLLAAAPETHFDVVESSARMIAIAQKRIANSDRVRFFCQNVLSAPLPVREYDGVVTFFFLDCFAEVELRNILPHVSASLAPGGLWLMTDFTIPQRGWRRIHALAWVSIMYRFFHITTGLRARTLPPSARLLEEVGMDRVDHRHWRWGMISAEVFAHRSPR